jgi:formylglycine-generating enzyme required for sulfatase activity
VFRGGSWTSYAVYCRAAIRRFISPVYRDFFLGFRLVRQ